MPIRARRRRRPALEIAAAAVAALTLVGCGPTAASADSHRANGEPQTAATTSSGCLAEVWQAQAKPDKAFDRAHDQADGGAISCATNTSPSRFAAALVAIHAAAASGDDTQLSGEVGFPLLFIDSAGTRRELDRKQLAAHADEVFSPAVLALLQRIALDDLAVVPREGAFADLGAVWLVAGRTGGRPRIVTIDQQALAEAAATAKRKLDKVPK